MSSRVCFFFYKNYSYFRASREKLSFPCRPISVESSVPRRELPRHNLPASYAISPTSRIGLCTVVAAIHTATWRYAVQRKTGARDTSSAFLQNYVHVSRENLTGTSAARAFTFHSENTKFIRKSRAKQQSDINKQDRKCLGNVAFSRAC